MVVSGTLEEGFPLRPNLDFTTEVNEGNPAVIGIFLGDALVRGVKAFLDIKDSNSREISATPSWSLPAITMTRVFLRSILWTGVKRPEPY
ncbi:MAG: hypothetical protein HY038_14095 [Nitrospirae bacterium]|nr:hypothetical protein [Nitrospirota bacterium]